MDGTIEIRKGVPDLTMGEFSGKNPPVEKISLAMTGK